MIRMILPAILPAALLLAQAPAALASTDEAWAEFRADVEAKCRAAQAQSGSAGETAIEVNPVGSERFGAAILTTTLADGASQERSICIYDKAARTVELTAPFDAPDAGAASVAAPVVAPGAAPAEKPAAVMDPAPPAPRSGTDAGTERPPQAP